MIYEKTGIGIYCTNPIPIVTLCMIYYICICMHMPYERRKRLKYIPIAEFIASAVMFYFIYNGKLKGSLPELAMLGTFSSSFLKGVSYIYIAYEKVNDSKRTVKNAKE